MARSRRVAPYRIVITHRDGTVSVEAVNGFSVSDARLNAVGMFPELRYGARITGRVRRFLVREYNDWSRQKFGDNPRKSAAKKNPPLVVFGNPPGKKSRGSKLLSKRAISIRYVHAADGQRYEHKFGVNDCIELLADGSFRVYNKSGKNLWKDFL